MGSRLHNKVECNISHGWDRSLLNFAFAVSSARISVHSRVRSFCVQALKHKCPIQFSCVGPAGLLPTIISTGLLQPSEPASIILPFYCMSSYSNMFSCLEEKLTGSLHPSVHQQLLRKNSQKKGQAFVDSTKISNSVP